MPSPSDGPTDPALRARLRPLFAEWEEADMANRVGKGDKPANLHRLIVAEQAIDTALAAAEAAPLDVERLARAIANVQNNSIATAEAMYEYADDIALEYAALRSPDTETDR